MDRNPVSSSVLAGAISTCAIEPEQLNSERILQRFGSCNIEILEQDSSVRRSNLFSTEDGKRTCRTYAVVRFVGSFSGDIDDAHDAIVSGRSIGATFRDLGWSVDKRTIFIGSIPASEADPEVSQLMRLESPHHLGKHVYELVLERNDESLRYATIVELHHPGYLDEKELRELYGQSD
ncbi:MAG: hypothetical protein GWN47_00665 [Woeseiaceae bacterium]|nr:hypothetical protein [Woeseiaceae bacterium]